jgi:hypothetical protein
MSMPITRRGVVAGVRPVASAASSIARSDALNVSEPPRATPVSTITSGRTSQTISCVTRTSGGNWMIGRPHHRQL